MYRDFASRSKFISINSSLRKMSKLALSTSASNRKIIHWAISMFRRSFKEIFKVFLQIFNVVYRNKEVVIQNAFSRLFYWGQSCKILNCVSAQSRLGKPSLVWIYEVVSSFAFIHRQKSISTILRSPVVDNPPYRAVVIRRLH